MDTRPAPQTGTVWADDHEPDPAWSPPEGVPTDTSEPGAPPPGLGRHRLPHPVILGVIAVALALLLVWSTGGFGVRSDLRIPTSAGQLITTGPYELTFTKATAQRKRKFSDEIYVEVKVIGTGRTTGNEAVAPSRLGNMFSAKDDASGEIREAAGQTFGREASVADGSHFTPGLPPIAYELTFEFSPNYQPGPTLRFAAAELEFSDHSLLGTGEKTWNNGDRLYVLMLPVTTLPDEIN